MAYRRRQGVSRSGTFFQGEIHHPHPHPDDHDDHDDQTNSPSSYLSPMAAAHTIRSSSSSSSSAFNSFSEQRSKDPPTYEYTSFQIPNQPKGFWEILAQKAKSIIDDHDHDDHHPSTTLRPQPLTTITDSQFSENTRRPENQTFRKSLDALASSLNHIGDTIGNALEEGRTMVENKTADIIQETRKLQIRRKGNSIEEQNQVPGLSNNRWQQTSAQIMQQQIQNNPETQLKASRDVAMATAAKAKLLLRELKTLKADMAFAKERCSQLEEENKILRDVGEKGINPADDDDMIRLQLETLLNEKARLAKENSVYARENRFLREIVEYHQLTMQDVVYLDEGIEEVTEVYPIPAITRLLSVSPPSPSSPISQSDDLPN
ncbi:uncharacterized protein LOC124933701 [Impatiens glandulifera]|uniref:uncharacterized protein LOC124933701 n=1 Tax=Impatiens glandulifera TaxID=253017 RepID=UPI001FB19D2D|nr:uncharacterized protein LOC124933701 [Impatiens glandulifera]